MRPGAITMLLGCAGSKMMIVSAQLCHALQLMAVGAGGHER